MLTEKEKPRSLVFWRWLDILLLTFVALVICYLLHPYLSSWCEKKSEYLLRLPSLVQWAFSAAIISLVWLFIIHHGGLPIHNFFSMATLRFPPAWISAIGGFVLYLLFSDFFLRLL